MLYLRPTGYEIQTGHRPGRARVLRSVSRCERAAPVEQVARTAHDRVDVGAAVPHQQRHIAVGECAATIEGDVDIIELHAENEILPGLEFKPGADDRSPIPPVGVTSDAGKGVDTSGVDLHVGPA